MTDASLLFYLPGASAWQRYSLPAPREGLTLNIGRSADNDIVLSDPSVSTRHAVLLVDPQGTFILDAGSRNGIVLNGQSIAVNEWIVIPPGSTFMLGDATCKIEVEEVINAVSPVQIAPPVQISPVPAQPYGFQPPSQKKKSALPWIIGGGVLFVAFAVLLWFTGDSLLGMFTTGTSGSRFTPQQLELTDGSTQTDANGVAVTIPTGTLQQVSSRLYTEELQPELIQEMKQNYKLVSPGYRLIAEGAEDGAQSATLTFPAADESYRVAAVIDNYYAAVLDVTPENGVITIPVGVHPIDASSLPSFESADGNRTIHYVLVKPNESMLSEPIHGRKMANPSRQTTPDRCISLTRSRCFQNGNASIQVMMNKDVSLTPVQTGVVLNYLQTLMDKYESLGFDGAIYNASNPVYVVIVKGSGTPLYSVPNGVVYLPNDIATKITGGGKDDFLVHEMAHWIQDESYNMTAAYYSGAGTWWLETAAENMVMLIDPGYLSKNLEVYGKIDSDEKLSAFQISPYTWPSGELYVQAQQVKVNMCSGSCPLTQETFVQAINEGTYPFDDVLIQAKLHSNLADYARYLLGEAPLAANTGIALDGVQTGLGYGDHIIVKQTTKSSFDTNDFAGSGRISDEVVNNLTNTLIQATLQKGGVYVLRIEIGPGNSVPLWPAVLLVDPGAPFYYRINDGEVQFNDGTKELVIQPIQKSSSGDNVTKVRLVAVGEQGGEIFKAHLSPVDLSGMWMMDLPDQSTFINHISCDDPGDNDVMANFLTGFTSLGFMFGDFKTDLPSMTLTWEGNLERASAILASAGGHLNSNPTGESNFTAEAVLQDGLVILTGTYFDEEETTFTVDPSSYSTQFITFPGTLGFSAGFSQIQYIGEVSSEMPSSYPNFKAWELSGGNIIFSVNHGVLVQRVNPQAQLEEEESRNHCTGTVEVNAPIYIYQPAN